MIRPFFALINFGICNLYDRTWPLRTHKMLMTNSSTNLNHSANNLNGFLLSFLRFDMEVIGLDVFNNLF